MFRLPVRRAGCSDSAARTLPRIKSQRGRTDADQIVTEEEFEAYG